MFLQKSSGDPMQLIKKVVKWVAYFLLIPIAYLLVSLVLSSITVERKSKHPVLKKSIYLVTNGIHLDIVIPKNDIDNTLLTGLRQQPTNQYFAFGWGDEDFYLNTQYLKDLTVQNAVNALFLKSPTLMHVTRYNNKQPDWVEIKISETELDALNLYIQNTFQLNENDMKIILENKGYSSTDDFYKAKGSYSAVNTCNTWVNSGFKQTGLKASLWTPFDFGLINTYK